MLENNKQKKALKLSLVLIVILLSTLNPLLAKVRIPSLISDCMVLQRDTELTIWGWADQKEVVTVRFLGQFYDAKPDEEGKWQVVIPPQKAGGPYIMEINEITIRDILIGDVFLCSGQSNQETPIARLVDMFPEINVSNNHNIRHCKIPTQEDFVLKDNISGSAVWNSGVASEVLNWTSLAYFLAQELYDRYKVPIGMLVSSKGGSNIESWISQEHLKEFPRLVLDKNALDSLQLAERDKGVAGDWKAEVLDDSDWATAFMPSSWREIGIKAKGDVWFRKNFELPNSMDRKHAKLYMGTLVNSDSVFVNGVFVGSTSYEYPPRKYDIPAGILHTGVNTIALKLTDNRGAGGFIKDKPYHIIGDDVFVDLGGEWKYKVGRDMDEMMRFRERLTNMKTVGSALYNGMIYPIHKYKVKAAVWYQGESNAGRPEEYFSLLTSLINNWRELYSMPDMPFLLVQLPNFMEKQVNPSGSGWAGIREAQLNVFKEIPHTALAVTYDIGEWNDIHPLNKKEMAHRVFLGARDLVFGERIISSGPIYQKMKIEGNKIILSFSEVGGGLRIKKGEKLHHFAIAGEDKQFVWATAEIKGNKVIVSNKNILNPVAVRYAWSNNPEEANLINKEGLLASPFRTDNW